MHKNFKLIMALIIGMFTVPVMSSAVFAQSTDEIANGTYENIGVRALEKGTDKESVANDFVQDPTLTIKDGNPTLTLGIGASGGGYADFDFTIEWVTVEGNEPTGSSDEGALTYYTFQLDHLDTIIPAEMKYVVPDFPPLSDGHEVEFDLELSGLDDLPEKVDQGSVTVTYVDQNGKEIADSETLTGDVGTVYEADQKAVDGYDFVKVNGDDTGEYAEETATVEYVYEKQEEAPEKAPEEREVGDLLTEDEADAVYELKYETESSSTSHQLKNPVKLLEKDDAKYIQISIDESGAQFFRSLEINGKEVTWNSITEGPYIIQFELPNSIEDELELSMVIQAGPTTMSHDVEISFDEESLKPIKVNQGSVTVTYVDQNGKEIADSKTLTGDVGTTYEADQKAVDGYDFVKVNGDDTGEYAEETATVEYVYEKQEEEADNGAGKIEENVSTGEVNPETGDNSNILLYLLLLVGSGVPLAFIAKRRFV